jgi:flagellar protein FlaG
MDPRISHLSQLPFVAALKQPAATATGKPFALPRAAANHDNSIPAFPPEDVLKQIDDAAARVDELHRAHRELHFEVDEHTGRVSIQVRDLEGHVIRNVPPSEALDIAAGQGL